MGICSKAKEVICCNKMTDIPIYQDNNNNNSFDSKKLYSQKISEEKNEVEIDINKPDIKYKNKHDFNNTEKVKIIDKKNKKLCFPNKDSRSQIFDVNKFHDNFKDIELKLTI